MAGSAQAAGGLSPIDELLIAGTGAMACLLAARLAAHGQRIVMLGTWPEGLAALREHGVRLVEPGGEAQAFSVRATSDPAECAGVRHALVLVKSWQTQRVGEQLRECLAEDGLALSLQNGLGNLETLDAALGPARAAVGTTTYAATIVSPGLVRALGEGEVALAEQTSARQAELKNLFTAAGLRVRRAADLRSLLWGKLVVNAAINPVTALLDIPNGEALKPTAWEFVRALALETAAVAAAMGISLPFADPVEQVRQVALSTAENSSSMRQDLRRGAPTEIDAINGVVVNDGEKYGVPTPLNRMMWQAVKEPGLWQKSGF